MPATDRDSVSHTPSRSREAEEQKDFGRQMLDTLDRSEHYQDELQERDLSFRERIAQAYRELEPLMDSPRLLKFVLDAREDRLDPARIDDFVHGAGARHRVGEESWKKVKEGLEDPGKLSGDSFQELAHEMAHQAKLAQYELIDIKLKRDTSLMEEKLESVNQRIEDNALDHLKEKSQHYPPPPMDHPDPHLRAAWNRIEQERLDQLTAKPEGWPLMELALQRREQAQEAFRTDGTLPDWLHPEWFTKERVETEPQHLALGYNHVHNRPVPLDGAPGGLEAYLRERMETTLQWNGRQNGGEDPAQFSRYLILPYLDPDLADPQTVHRGGNAAESTPSDPLSHAGTTYARLVRDCLRERGIIEAAQEDRPDLLAEALRDNVVTIARMTSYLREKQEELHPPEPGRPNWDTPTGERWKTVLQATSNLTDTKQIIADVLKLQESTAHASMQAHTLDSQHPAKYLVMEAALDLRSAKDALDRTDLEQGYQLVDQAVRTGHMYQLTEQFRTQHRGENYIQEMMKRAEQHPVSMIREYRAQGYDEQMAQDLAEIEAEVRSYQTPPATDQRALEARDAALAGMEPTDAMRIEDLALGEPQKVFLFDQAVRLMAHAQFNLATVANDLNQNRAESPKAGG